MTFMSAEFITEYNENTICAAVENMELNMRTFDYVGEYVQDIQELYADYPEGKIELIRMIRAAQLITNRGATDTSEEVQAVYHGELLGLELINNLQPEAGQFFKTGYAQSFIKFQLDKDRPTHTEAAESNLEHQMRLVQLSQSLQSDLTYPIYEHGLNPIYEEFGEKTTSKLSNKIQYQNLAMIGFRMIITEALKPSLNSLTNEVMEKFQVPLKERSMPPLSIADLERNYAQSIYNTDEIIGEQEGVDFVEWEDISFIRKTLYKKFTELDLSEEGPQVSGLSTIAEIDQYIEGELMEFAQNYELIGANDFLSIRGNFYSALSDENFFTLYDKQTEIRGNFGGIHVVQAPSKRQLQRAVNLNIDSEEEEEEEEVLVCALALRVVNPVLIEEREDGKTTIKHTQDKTIDIPLNYKNVTYMRIKAEELEPEA